MLHGQLIQKQRKEPGCEVMLASHLSISGSLLSYTTYTCEDLFELYKYMKTTHLNFQVLAETNSYVLKRHTSIATLTKRQGVCPDATKFPASLSPDGAVIVK